MTSGTPFNSIRKKKVWTFGCCSVPFEGPFFHMANIWGIYFIMMIAGQKFFFWQFFEGYCCTVMMVYGLVPFVPFFIDLHLCLFVTKCCLAYQKLWSKTYLNTLYRTKLVGTYYTVGKIIKFSDMKKKILSRWDWTRDL